MALAINSIGKEILINTSGYMHTYFNCWEAIIDLVYTGDTTISTCSKMLHVYKQATYPVEKSWIYILVCLIVHSIDPNLDTVLLEIFKNDTAKFEWSILFNNKKQKIN